MKEKRRNVTGKKMRLFLMLILVLTMTFSSVVSAETEEEREEKEAERLEKITHYLSDIESSSDPVYLISGDIIKNDEFDKDEGNGLVVRYELSESSSETFPGTKAYYEGGMVNGAYLGNTHEVHSYELNGETYSLWRVKRVTSDAGYINVILIPANNHSSNYVGSFYNWTNESGDYGTISIKNTVEPENCYANFINGSHRVIIDEGTDYETKLVYEEDFDASYGSTVITIEPSIMQGLRNGNHTITVSFRDGRCKVNFVKDWDKAYAAGSQPSNEAAQTNQKNTAQAALNGKKLAPKTGEV